MLKKRLHPNYMSQKEYKQMCAERCPRCFSNRINPGGITTPEDSTTVLVQEMMCNNCGAVWNEEYTLTCFHADRNEWLEKDRDDLE